MEPGLRCWYQSLARDSHHHDESLCVLALKAGTTGQKGCCDVISKLWTRDFRHKDFIFSKLVVRLPCGFFLCLFSALGIRKAHEIIAIEKDLGKIL